jgi:hypothetical protein
LLLDLPTSNATYRAAILGASNEGANAIYVGDGPDVLANRALIVREQRQLVDFVARLLGEMNPSLDANARRAAAMLYFGVINWTHTWYRPDGPVSPDEVADMATAMALRGLARA